MNEFNIFDACIQTPSNLIIVGQSQSGKTFFVDNLLGNGHRLFNPVPEKVIWFYHTKSDIVSKLDTFENVNVIQGIPENGFDEFIEPEINQIFVLDDLLLECFDNQHVTNLFCRTGSKSNVTNILLVQDLYCYGRQRQTILRQAHYLVLFKSPLDKTFITAVGRRIQGRNIKPFLDIYESATATPYGYLFISGHPKENNLARFRTDIFNFFQKVFIPNP